MLAATAATACIPGLARAAGEQPDHKETDDMTQVHWPISLAQWSLHRMLQSGDLTAENFPTFSRERFGISGVEYVNSFFKDRATDDAWLESLRTRCDEAQVRSLIIMVDSEGALGDPSKAGRSEAVSNHRRWLHAAKTLGCHGIRVNVPSEGTPDEQRDLCAKGLSELLEHADAMDLSVMIENHGGLSSNGAWLASLLTMVGHPRLGTLPDFGNFTLDWDTGEQYDRYQGVDELLPWAKALSAKSHAFDKAGDETATDYGRMFELVRKHGYTGWVGVEYEGDGLSEVEGIEQTRDLLIRHGCVLEEKA
jgi:sugar phosphate isomerase/epimerase